MDGKYKILDTINSPADLRRLTDNELDLLAVELREFLVENVTQTGGHLASNLGVVELTMAIHRVMNVPHDHIIWDVGHQSYVHKILTGRRDRFDTLRCGGGLSGFTNRSESEYDCFGAGHSSTSLSAALGFAEADKLSGSDAYTVAVVGDGAFTGGMIHEALNCCNNDLKLIIIINENEMSISKNIGHFANNMAHLRTGSGYLKTKKATRNFIKHIPLIGGWIFRRIRNLKKAFKNMMYGSNYFEDLGLYYLGPVDGHNRAAVERLIEEAKAAGQSAVIHVKTIKGRGFAPAEMEPGRYHGMSPKGCCKNEKCFSDIMGGYITELADNDKEICAVTAAMCDGTGLKPFSEKHPDRFFDVGIAEEHALTFAAGLAAEKMKPVVCIYSTFLQRGYDNIIHDIAIQKLPVVLCVDRAGLNSADGATHHGIFDVSFLSQIPGMTIFTPITSGTLKSSLDEALKLDAPCAVRYPNGGESQEIIKAYYSDGDFSLKGARADYMSDTVLRAVIVTDGRIAKEALKAESILAEQGIAVGIILLEKIKPYDECAVRVRNLIPQGVELLLFLEEEIRNGGMGMLLSDAMRQAGMTDNMKTVIMAVDDEFVIRKSDEPVYKTAGLTADNVVNTIISNL